MKGAPSVFTFLISTLGAWPACGEPVEPVPAGFDPLHITAPAMKSPPTMTAIGKRYLLPVSLFVSISEDYTMSTDDATRGERDENRDIRSHFAGPKGVAGREKERRNRDG